MTLSLMACGLRGMHITPNGAEYIEPRSWNRERSTSEMKYVS
eukprot:CAMPEP_0115517326 /NCGR_PEP_ID=MMETSP0271-20121206/77254_1 /TAXON_ID=71861 /ORGANISM="Scrippsiella trochoidea, Strain CCMP3099" /LENGTH=41 /DNA_ID= /DNA_START= /DNA_END= /DNA_ORIENTATION=